MLIIQALYYFLPAYVANMSPNFFRKSLHFLGKPIDNGSMYRGKRILGDNKTWRGLIMGTIMAILTILIQRSLALNPTIAKISLFDYSLVPLPTLIALGFLLGFGALAGDSIKSFFKRQSGVPSGTSWFPFDQLDFVIGGLLFSFLIFIPSWQVMLIIIILSPVLHVIVKYIGYLLKIDKKKF
jgi:CDP-2,3-bis-(O-geranylgeranyl)-sn-glycerol synthase